MTPEEWSATLDRITRLENSVASRDRDLEQMKREASTRSDHVALLGDRLDGVEALLDSYRNTVTTVAARIDSYAGQTAADAMLLVTDSRRNCKVSDLGSLAPSAHWKELMVD